MHYYHEWCLCFRVCSDISCLTFVYASTARLASVRELFKLCEQYFHCSCHGWVRPLDTWPPTRSAHPKWGCLSGSQWICAKQKRPLCEAWWSQWSNGCAYQAQSCVLWKPIASTRCGPLGCVYSGLLVLCMWFCQSHVRWPHKSWSTLMPDLQEFALISYSFWSLTSGNPSLRCRNEALRMKAFKDVGFWQSWESQ